MASGRTMLGKVFVAAAAALLCCAAPGTAAPTDETRNEIRAAMKLAHEGNHAAAIETINRVLTREPENPRAHLCLGVVYFKSKRYDPALDELNRVVSLKKDSLLAYYFTGLIYEAKAVDETDKAAAKDMKRKALAAWNEYLAYAATATAAAPNDVRAIKPRDGIERARQHIAVLEEDLRHE